jgi:hypothetical protein
MKLKPLPGKRYVWQGRWPPTGLVCEVCDNPDGHKQFCGEIICSECLGDHLLSCSDCANEKAINDWAEYGDLLHDQLRQMG